MLLQQPHYTPRASGLQGGFIRPFRVTLTNSPILKRGIAMAVTVTQSDDNEVFEIEASGSLSRADYEVFVPVLEARMKQGPVRLLFSMRDFTGWNVGALWEDIKFDIKHFRDIKRLAMVGDKKWEKGMAWFCKPFTTASIAYFDRSEIENARTWLRE